MTTSDPRKDQSPRQKESLGKAQPLGSRHEFYSFKNAIAQIADDIGDADLRSEIKLSADVEELTRLSVVVRAKVRMEIHESLNNRVAVERESASPALTLGRIILDLLNRDISIVDGVKALRKFKNTGWLVARQESRLKRAKIHSVSGSVRHVIRSLKGAGVDHIRETIELIKQIRQDDPIRAGEFAEEIVNDCQSHGALKFAAFSIYKGGKISLAKQSLSRTQLDLLTQNELLLAEKIISEDRIVTHGAQSCLDTLIESVTAKISKSEYAESHERKIAYVLASSLPQNQVGYTTRTHYLLKAMMSSSVAAASGIKVFPVTRPGYPEDRFDLDDSTYRVTSEYDQVCYHHLKSPIPMQGHFLRYAEEASENLANWMLKNQIRVVHAASNYVNAFPALIAARALNIPFIYEVRGLWEETTASKIDGWDRTERYRFERMMENFIINEADGRFFLTEQLRDFFQQETSSKGANSKKAHLFSDVAPNSIDANPKTSMPLPEFGPSKEHSKIRMLYIGSIVEYEGLQTLVSAFAKDSALQDKFQLTIVGGGKFLEELKNQIRQSNVQASVEMVGKVPQSEVLAFYKQAHCVCVPRLPYKVCQLVSPLKPLEAMANNRVVFGSDVKPIADLIEHGKTGFLFKSGSVDNAIIVLHEMFDQRFKFDEISQNANNYLVNNRSWAVLADNIAKRYLDLLL